jgi:hypothetical protein
VDISKEPAATKLCFTIQNSSGQMVFEESAGAVEPTDTCSNGVTRDSGLKEKMMKSPSRKASDIVEFIATVSPGTNLE